MASNENPCCALLKERYSKLEEKRNALRQAVKLLEQQIEKIQSDNLRLKKAHDEAQTKAEFERKEKLKESDLRISMENEISSLKSEISSLQLKGGLGTQDGDGAERGEEVNRLKKLLEEERVRADLERTKAEAEKSKAAEAWRILKSEKGKADKEKKTANLEGKKAGEYKLQLEILKKEVSEAKSKAEEANKRCEIEKQKAAKEKIRADLEISKAEEQRKLAEANEKKSIVEKSKADHLSKLLKEDRQRIKKLQKEIDELVSSRKSVEALAIPLDKSVNTEALMMEVRKRSEKMKSKADDGKFVKEFMKSKELYEKIHLEKQKVAREKKHADLETAKAKLAKENRKKAMKGKSCADHLSQQLERNRLGDEEFKKGLNGLVSSGNLAVAPAVPFDMGVTIENMKLLKRKLKFEKMQVKYAKQMAKLEKDRNRMMQKELWHLKQHFVQFSHNLDMLDNCFLHEIEGTNDIGKDENFSDVQQLKLKRRPCGIEPSHICLLSENRLVNRCCMSINSSDLFRPTQERNVPLLPISGGNSIGSISSIDSQSVSLLGGSDKKMLRGSAINSSLASFSDRQLVGSQDRGAYSVTTSAKLAEEISDPCPLNSSFSPETTKIRYNGDFGAVAENCVKHPFAFDVARRDTGCSKKRKRVHPPVKTIENLHSVDKKLPLQEEKQLSILDEFKRNIHKPLEGGRSLVSDLQAGPNAKNGRLGKKLRVSHKKEVVLKPLSHPEKKKKAEKLLTEGNDKPNPSITASTPADNYIEAALGYKVALCTSDRSNQNVRSFEELVNGDYMKLLDLDNPVDEACYRLAVENPLSPTLPEIEFHDDKASEVDKSNCLEEIFNNMLSIDHLNSVPSPSFDVINFKIDSNLFRLNLSDTSESPLLLRCDGLADSLEKPKNNENSVHIAISYGGKTCSSFSVEEGTPNLPVSINEGTTFPSKDEIGAPHDHVSEICIIFSDINEKSCIGRIFCAIRTCLARCHLVSQSDWMVEEIIHALIMEEDLLPKEKACALFSLFLHNLSGAALNICQNISTAESISCLNSFSAQINTVLSNEEIRSLFTKLCHLDELLSLIEEFIIDKKVLVYNNALSESLSGCNSRMVIHVDGTDIIMSSETASTHQLVAGSIILSSLCSATDRIGFICEASYAIFQTHRSDSLLLLTILHVFAEVCGKKYFTLSSYSLIMSVMKSLVMLIEGPNLPKETIAGFSCQSGVQNKFPPCIQCPFSHNAASVDIVIAFLLEKLQDYAISQSVDRELTKLDKSVSVRFLSSNDKTEMDFPEALCTDSVNCGMPCCLKDYEMPAILSGSDFNRSLCHFIDILSLVELVASNVSWEWTFDKIVSRLLKMLSLSIEDGLSAALVILLGQLGRIGVDAGGYEDIGVEAVKSGLYSYLCKMITREACLPLRISAISALLRLLPDELKEFVLSNVKDIPDATSRSALVHDMRNWFSLLSQEQQSFAASLNQSSGNHMNKSGQCSYRFVPLNSASAL